jgi:hypothetical protein
MAFGADFAPETLKISAPQIVMYDFDGRELKISLTVSGTPADITLLIFTNEKSASISGVRNGFLGWHYVDRIDTCFYISASKRFQPGDRVIRWDGKNENGVAVPPGEYTYYLWGYDAESPPKKAVNSLRFLRFDRSHMQTRGPGGAALSNPALYDAPRVPSAEGMQRIVRSKWVIGDDPSDSSLIETTAYEGYQEHSRLALDSADHSWFFVRSETGNGFEIRKFRWMPNGNAELQTGWGEGGRVAFDLLITSKPAALYGLSDQPFSGPVSNGTGSLFFTETWINLMPSDISSSIYSGAILMMNEQDGSIRRFFTPSPFPTGKHEQFTGIGSLAYANSLLFTNSPTSCLAMMIDPYTEKVPECVLWSNGNGDLTGDRNFEPGSSNPWMCNDVSRPPYFGSLAPDINRFSLFPVEGLGAASFGAFAPDGTGLGYFTLPGMENGTVYGLQVVDAGSAFDGLYYGGITAGGDSAGVWYTGYDTFRGSIRGDISHYGPHITFTSPWWGDTLQSGTESVITWKSDGIEMINIEFSADEGATWTAVADSVNGRSYTWTVPTVNSPRCMLRATSVREPLCTFRSLRFTVSGPVSVTDESIPHPFVTVSNHPNPFNPSTVIRYELGLPGRVMLTIFNALGQEMRQLDLGRKDRGAHEYRFDGSGLTSGVYFYRVETEKAAATGKMLLVR